MAVAVGNRRGGGRAQAALESYRRDAQRADALTRAQASDALSAQQAQTAAARAQLLQDQIAIFLALGGGWRP